MCSYYFKCYDLFNKGASEEDMVAEDSRLVHEMVKKLKISDEDFTPIREEIKNLKVQLEDPEEEAARREMRDLDTEAISLQNELEKQQDLVQKRYSYRNELQDKITKLNFKHDMLKARNEKRQADISKMKHVVDNQRITLEDKKRIESECRQLQETIRVNQACCDAWSKAVYADDLKIAKMKNELTSKCIAYNTSIMENRNALPELDAFKMPMNFLHKDTELIMQVRSTVTV
jgi:chromosome segregation ATPase